MPLATQAQQRSNAKVTTYPAKTVAPNTDVLQFADQFKQVLTSGNPGELDKLVVSQSEMNAVADAHGINMVKQMNAFVEKQTEVSAYLQELMTNPVTDVTVSQVEHGTGTNDLKVAVPEFEILQASGGTIVKLALVKVGSDYKVLFLDK